jgi:hypothetical protein
MGRYCFPLFVFFFVPNSYVFFLFGLENRRLQIPRDGCFVSQRLQTDYRFVCGKFTNFHEMTTGVYTPLNCCLPSCWSAGGGFLFERSHQ